MGQQTDSAQVVICGAGIVGVSVAFHLARAGMSDVIVVDERPPLTLTSDKSTECYRNWWPTRSMVALMQRSIDLIDQYSAESGDRFTPVRRGYLYATGTPEVLADMVRDAQYISSLGAGTARLIDEPQGQPDPTLIDGADVYTSGEALRSAFEYISGSAIGGIHVRRAGWLSAQQLGAWMIEQAELAGVHFVTGRVVDVTIDDRSVAGVQLHDGSTIATRSFVNAAGPLVDKVAELVGVDLPVHSEIHQKVSFKDHRIAFPRHAPMVIWNDPQRIEWDDDVAAMLIESGYAAATETLPPFVHGRPEGGEGSEWALGLWEWNTKTTTNPTWPLAEDPLYPELVLRGLSTVLPAMGAYADALPQATIDGGYYTKTVENVPLVGPVGPVGSYVCGAVSGYGIMAACAVGELAALHVTGAPLPGYASALDVGRYDDPAYVASLTTLGASGQI